MPYQQTLTALADPNRRMIVQLLRGGPRNVSNIAQNFQISRPAVSQHLKVLCDAGLLRATPVGNRRHYSLCTEGVDDLRTYLDEMWGTVLDSFADHIERTSEND